MKKSVYSILLLVCMIGLWTCLSGFRSVESGSSVYYESGMWQGNSCGSYSGNGQVTYQYGGSYCGSFIGSHPSGTGTYTYADGQSVSGTFSWTSGTDYVMEGPLSGSYPHYNGTEMTYVGMMKNGEPCGFGELDFHEGGTFYGEFRDGTVRGKGVYVYREPDSKTEVSGSDWKLVSRKRSSLGGRWYSGLINGKTWQGFGMLCYNYSYYIGEVKDNYCYGHGTYWQWKKSGDPSGTLTRKDYGHYSGGKLKYTCSHGSKDCG